MSEFLARPRPPALPPRVPLTPLRVVTRPQANPSRTAPRSLDWAASWTWDGTDARHLPSQLPDLSAGGRETIQPVANNRSAPGGALHLLALEVDPPKQTAPTLYHLPSVLTWRLPPVLAGVLGFVIGAIFWHLIGFWGFVAQVVTGPSGEHRSKIERVAGPSGQDAQTVPRPPLRLRTLSAALNCTMAAKNSLAVTSQSLPCPINSAELTEGVGVERADQMPIRLPQAAAKPASATRVGAVPRLQGPADSLPPSLAVPTPVAPAAGNWAPSVKSITPLPE